MRQIEQKMFLTDLMIDIRDQPARAWHSLTGYFSISSKDTNLKFKPNLVYCFDIVVTFF